MMQGMEAPNIEELSKLTAERDALLDMIQRGGGAHHSALDKKLDEVNERIKILSEIHIEESKADQITPPLPSQAFRPTPRQQASTPNVEDAKDTTELSKLTAERDALLDIISALQKELDKTNKKISALTNPEPEESKTEDAKKADIFFDRLLGQAGPFSPLRGQIPPNTVFVTVSHLVPSLPPFIEAISKIAPLVAVIPKGSSRRQYQAELPFYQSMQRDYAKVLRNDLNREVLKDPVQATAFFEQITGLDHDKRVIIIDEGGYFADFVQHIMFHCENDSWLRASIISINEVTLNGQERYVDLLKMKLADDSLLSSRLTFPISSIARSSIKSREDREVGIAIVRGFDTALMADLNTSLRFEPVSIFGCGVIGAASAKEAAFQTRFPIRLHDLRPDNMLSVKQAARTSTEVYTDKKTFLANAKFLISATGKRGLQAADIEQLPNEAVIACVTSRDDELGKDAITVRDPNHPDQAYRYERIDHSKQQFTAQYRHLGTRKIVNLVLDGNAVNFVTNSVVGPGIYGVMASTLVCAFRACENNPNTQAKPDRLNVLTEEDIQDIEETHRSVFGEPRRETETFGLYAESRFIGRANELALLTEALQAERKHDHELCSRNAVIGESIAGLGGVGKSRLAREYARQCRTNGYYDYIIIFDATSPLTLTKSFRELAMQLSLPMVGLHHTARLVQSVYQALLRYQRILIIYDNAESYAALRGQDIRGAMNANDPPGDSVCFLPAENAGCIIHWIATTRNSAFSVEHPPITLGEFSREDAINYIFDALTLERSLENETHANDLAEKLHFFPLALSQAVAYIKSNPHAGGILRYLHLYQHSPVPLYDFVAPGSEYTKSLYITWWLSWRALQENHDTEALKLLEYCAFLEPKNIPESLLADFVKEEVKSDADSLNDALERLSSYSLVDRQPNACLNVHALVQEVTRLHMQRPLPPVQHTSIPELLSHVLRVLHDSIEDIASLYDMGRGRAPDMQRLLYLMTHVASFEQHYERDEYVPRAKRKSGALAHLLYDLGSFQCFRLYETDGGLRNLEKCHTMVQSFPNLSLPKYVREHLPSALEQIRCRKDPRRFPQFQTEDNTLLSQHLAIVTFAGLGQFDLAEAAIGNLLRTQLSLHSRITTEALRGLIFGLQRNYDEQRSLLLDIARKIESFEHDNGSFDNDAMLKVLFGLVIAEGMLQNEEASLHYLRRAWMLLWETHGNALKGYLDSAKAYAMAFKEGAIAHCADLIFAALAGGYQALDDEKQAQECVSSYNPATSHVPLHPSYLNRYCFFAVPRTFPEPEIRTESASTQTYNMMMEPD